ncbi:MAG: hypothetical protein ACQEP1_00540 [Nanobdellota archaeon]
MKSGKIKLGIATLAMIIALGYSTRMNAQENKDVNIKAGIELGDLGPYRNENSDISSLKGTLGAELDSEGWNIRAKGNHTVYSGELEDKITEGKSNSVRLDVGRKINEGVFLSPYALLKDDMDPLREFTNNNVYSVAGGLAGEVLVKEPFTIIGDARVTSLSNQEIDHSANLGLMYYFGKDRASIKGATWKESIRDVRTNMIYGSFHHEFTDDLSTDVYGGIGKEKGSEDRNIMTSGIKLNYNIKENLEIGVSYRHYGSKGEGQYNAQDIVGVNARWGL